MFKMKVLQTEHIFKIFNKIDEVLMKFGGQEANNKRYKKADPQLFAGICKKPTYTKAEKYKENHKEEQRDVDDILNDNNTLNTYIQFKYKLPINNENKTISIFNKDTAINNLKVEKKEDEDIDFDIDQPYTIDFLNDLTKKGNNIDLIINIGSWYSIRSAVKYYGYKAFINKITLNSYNDSDGDDVMCFKGNNAILIKSNKTQKEIKQNEETQKENKQENNKKQKQKEENQTEEDEAASDDNQEIPEVDNGESEEQEEEKPKTQTVRKVNKKVNKKEEEKPKTQTVRKVIKKVNKKEVEENNSEVEDDE